MEALKKQRKSARAAFTRAATQFTDKLKDSSVSIEDKTLSFQLLEIKKSMLDEAHADYNKGLFSMDTMDEDEIQKEVDTDDAYLTNFLSAQMKMATLLSASSNTNEPRPVASSSRKTTSFPKLEIPKFQGTVKDWLPFWSQFKKIHDERDMPKEDKFQRLLQATIPGTRARDIVQSYPPTAENYDKVINSLKNRFGRDDLLVECYVRELLGLVLQNAGNGGKCTLSNLYDKLETYIHALESLGVTTEKCAAMLYPLVESALPDELLRVWQRSGEYKTTQGTTLDQVESDNDAESTKDPQQGIDRLTGLLTFLRIEVESEERIEMSRTGFGLPNGQDQLKKTSKDKTVERGSETISKNVASASVLLTTNDSKNNEISKCIFCNARHQSPKCEHARKLPFNERRDAIKKAGACFYCLNRGHVAKKCRVRVLCDWCSGRHTLLMCSGLNKGGTDPQNSGKDKANTEECALTNFSVRPAVWLQTLKVKIFSDKKELTIRAIIDTASHRSYIRSAVAKTLGYASRGKRDVVHNLFGGLKSDNAQCNEYVVRVKNLDGPERKTSGAQHNDRSDVTLSILTTFVREANLTALWELDALGITDPIQKLDKDVQYERTRKFLIETAKLNTDGRYEVKLPWVEDHAPVPNNYDIAEHRLGTNLARLKKQNLFCAYNEILNEWQTEGIIEVAGTERGKLCHYLPHRPVLKEYGTTKIRPVFDASSAKRGLPSLNNCLETGPNLIELVPSVLNRFRVHEIGIVADIKKAFLQIAINEADRDFLRFLWVSDTDAITFRHCRVVFGLACSPFILSAIIELHLSKALKKCLLTDKTEWTKETVEKLSVAFYVDNCVTSVESRQEAHKFIREASTVMLEGGFELRGWETTDDGAHNPSTLVLGLLWNKKEDTIAINPSLLDTRDTDEITKRNILSQTQRIFDPIGITCPVSLQPKLILRSLWMENVGWDCEVTGKVKQEFESWRDKIPLLKQLRIPRRIGEGKLTVHVFGDASALAYAAAVFARVENGNKITVGLVNARSRVSPKQATMPRLELMAATSTISSLTREVSGIYFWTDSTTVLAWIRRDTQWGVFVWNRVKEIRTLSKVENWRYVPSEMNAADLPSRGCDPEKLIKSEWWFGPKWLYRSEAEWPVADYTPNEDEVAGEVRKTVNTQMVVLEANCFRTRDHFESYSKFMRFCTWAKRFCINCRAKIEKKKTAREKADKRYSTNQERKSLFISCKEILKTELQILKYLQHRTLLNNDKGKLSSFKTWVDDNGLYVLKTKITNRKDETPFLAPILLDNDDDILYLLVRETHEKLGHGGVLVTMNVLRERFWVISLRKMARKIISKCVICNRQQARHLECDPPPLPINRVRDAAVFEIVGVDFAGPLFLRGGGKAWICLFTYAVYRAVHLELASSLSAIAFIECLRRFVARRGRPRIIYCDNGTNFVGTRNIFNTIDWNKIKNYSSAIQIEWIFNPPSAPWWGGWWERLVGVLKRILRKTLGRASLTYQELTTVLCESEAVINARPITYVSEDPEDLRPIAPSMFLQEGPALGMPECEMLSHAKLGKKLRYRQKVLRDLKARFRIEYLGSLIQKNKKRDSREIGIGDIVLIGDDTRKRVDWPLARVIDSIPGRDGKTRVFILKTKDGTLKRPLQRLYPLEVEKEENSTIDDLREGARKNEEYVKAANSRIISNVTDLDNRHNINKDEPENTVTSRVGRKIKKPQRYLHVL